MMKNIVLTLTLTMMSGLAAAEVKTGFWNGVGRNMPATPNGNIAAVSCHNCYVYSTNAADSLSATLNKIHDAQAKEADLIELDVVYYNNAVRVAHGQRDTKSALFDDVLADSALRSGDEVLFIEIKQSATSTDFIADILDSLQEYGYAQSGRPVVLRAAHTNIDHLSIAETLLAGTYSAMANHVMLSVLFFPSEALSLADMQDAVLAVRQNGYHMAEFNYQQSNLFSFISLARSLGLGVNLWTIPSRYGEVFVAALREEVDALTVDYDVAKAREVITDRNSIMYINTSLQNGAGELIRYQFTNGKPQIHGLSHSSAPEFELLGFDENHFGGSVVFDASAQQYLAFHDGDNSPGNGFLVSTVVSFDDLTLSEGETVSILAKSDSGGFCLEMNNPTSGAPVLRFGVRVGSSYKYATYPVANLNSTDSYQITGAYDGNGGIYIWINNSLDDTTRSSGSGEVVRNNSPILLGADPQGTGNPRFFFSGKIQMAVVQDWGNH